MTALTTDIGCTLSAVWVYCSLGSAGLQGRDWFIANIFANVCHLLHFLKLCSILSKKWVDFDLCHETDAPDGVLCHYKFRFWHLSLKTASVQTDVWIFTSRVLISSRNRDSVSHEIDILKNSSMSRDDHL